MKIKAFSTDNYGICRERELFTTKERIAGGLRVDVSEETVHSGFQGFGVAITGSSCFLLEKMPKEKRASILADIYGENGLGLSVARMSIGASDYSAEVYSYEDENGKFSIEKDEAYVLPILQEVAEKYPDVKFFASPWSPPGRMKTGGSMCGGFMREKFLDEYVDYIINFVRAYQEKGISIWAITPQNEPETDQGGRMPACYWSPETEANFAISLKKKADGLGLPFEIWLCDHNFALWQRVIWQLKEFPELEKSVSSAAFHYYDGGVDLIENIREEYPALSYHFTEGGPRLFDNYATDHCKWGTAMARALNHGCKSFTGWNLILDEMGNPNVGPYFCGGLLTERSDTKEISYSGQYQAFRHFSPYIKRGAAVLKTRVVGENKGLFGYPNQKPLVDVCAVQNPDGRIVLTIVNPDNNERRQMGVCVFGETIYFDALPNSLNTILIEK